MALCRCCDEPMRVPIDDYSFIDLDAPTLPAEEVVQKRVRRWRVSCRHCEAWNVHGPREGHREAHCNDPASPYYRTGYNLARA